VGVPAGVTFAHGDDPRIAIDIATLAPGGALTVRGFDFPYEDDVELALRGSGGDTALGSVTTDLEGAFTHTVAVPVDQPPGAYVVVATDSHHEATSAPFMLEGAPLLDDDGGRIDEGDSLLAPMPTVAPAVAQATTLPAAAVTTTPATTVVAVTESPAVASEQPVAAVVVSDEGDEEPGSGTSAGALLLVAAIVAAVVAAGTWIIVRKRRTRRSSDGVEGEHAASVTDRDADQGCVTGV
jgi:hypothetical protein